MKASLASALLFLGGLLSLPTAALSDSQVATQVTEPGETRLQVLDRAHSFFIAGQLHRAEELWRQIALEHPGDRSSLLGLAAGSLATGDSLGFLRARAKMEESPSASSEWRALKAATELSLQGESLSSLESLTEQLPLSPLPYFSLGVIHASLGHWQRACRDFAEARSRAPEWPDIVYNLAACVDRLGEGPRAARLYRQALALVKLRPAQFAPDTLVPPLAQLTQGELRNAEQESGRDKP